MPGSTPLQAEGSGETRPQKVAPPAEPPVPHSLRRRPAQQCPTSAGGRILLAARASGSPAYVRAGTRGVPGT